MAKSLKEMKNISLDAEGLTAIMRELENNPGFEDSLKELDDRDIPFLLDLAKAIDQHLWLHIKVETESKNALQRGKKEQEPEYVKYRNIKVKIYMHLVGMTLKAAEDAFDVNISTNAKDGSVEVSKPSDWMSLRAIRFIKSLDKPYDKFRALNTLIKISSRPAMTQEKEKRSVENFIIFLNELEIDDIEDKIYTLKTFYRRDHLSEPVAKLYFHPQFFSDGSSAQLISFIHKHKIKSECKGPVALLLSRFPQEKWDEVVPDILKVFDAVLDAKNSAALEQIKDVATHARSEIAITNSSFPYLGSVSNVDKLLAVPAEFIEILINSLNQMPLSREQKSEILTPYAQLINDFPAENKKENLILFLAKIQSKAASLTFEDADLKTCILLLFVRIPQDKWDAVIPALLNIFNKIITTVPKEERKNILGAMNLASLNYQDVFEADKQGKYDNCTDYNLIGLNLIAPHYADEVIFSKRPIVFAWLLRMCASTPNEKVIQQLCAGVGELAHMFKTGKSEKADIILKMPWDAILYYQVNLDDANKTLEEKFADLIDLHIIKNFYLLMTNKGKAYTKLDATYLNVMVNLGIMRLKDFIASGSSLNEADLKLLENTLKVFDNSIRKNSHEMSKMGKDGCQEQLIFAGTWGHASAYFIHEEIDGTWSFTIFNSGGGAHKYKYKFECIFSVKYTGLSKKDLDSDFLKALRDFCSEDISISELYEFFDAHFEGKQKVLREHTPHVRGCSAKLVEQIFREMLGDHLHRRLKVAAYTWSKAKLEDLPEGTALKIFLKNGYTEEDYLEFRQSCDSLQLTHRIPKAHLPSSRAFVQEQMDPTTVALLKSHTSAGMHFISRVKASQTSQNPKAAENEESRIPKLTTVS